MRKKKLSLWALFYAFFPLMAMGTARIDLDIETPLNPRNLWIAPLDKSGIAGENRQKQLHLIAFFKSPHPSKADIQKTVEAIQQLGGQAKTFPFLNLMAIDLPNHQLGKLSEINGLSQISQNRPGQPESSESFRYMEKHNTQPANPQAWRSHAPAALLPASSWWTDGYTGKRTILGVLDGGVSHQAIEPSGEHEISDHPALYHKKFRIRTDSDSTYSLYPRGVRSPHGTGVSCIYGSEDPDVQGIAYGISEYLIALAGALDDEGPSLEAGMALSLSSLNWMISQQPTPTLINYSIGHGSTQITDWSAMAKTMDFFIQRYRVLWVKSAGNQGWVAPRTQPPFSPTLTSPADNYNGITVANLMPEEQDAVASPDRDRHFIYPTSSRGPTLLGRKKPDLAAIGTHIRTCAADPGVYADSPEHPNPGFPAYKPSMDFLNLFDSQGQFRGGFRLMTGSSAATPMVGASVALLRDAGIQDPMLVKALLINSADARSSNAQPGPQDKKFNCEAPWQDCGHHGVKGSHWDPSYGWGDINLEKAAKEKGNLILSQLDLTHRTQTYVGHLKPGDKITLVHERRVGFHEDNSDWAMTPLTLTLIDARNHQVLAEDNSPIDNVHQVSVPFLTDLDPETPIPIIVTVAIATGINQIDGGNQEPFALASTGKLEAEKT